MKLNSSINWVAAARRWMAGVLVCLATLAVLNVFSLNTPAAAAPTGWVIAGIGDAIQDAADEVRDRSKELIRDSKKNVERTADKNAAKVDRADDEGGVAESKAMRDRSRIYQRAEEHADRTERAVDRSMNAVKNAVDDVKDAFQ